MTTGTDHSPSIRSGRLDRVTAVMCALAMAAAVVKSALASLPARLDYTVGYAPWWTGIIGAALGIAVVVSWVRSVPRPLGLAVGWLGAALLLWASSGVVLDGFRSFFAVTGIPAGEFAVVDWPGYASRLLSLLACGSTLATVVRYQTVNRGDCRECGRTVTGRASRRRLGRLAMVLVWPYPLIKVYWWLGGTVARPAAFDEGLPAGELLGAAVATVLCMALVQRWGHRLPRWMPLTAGWLAASALVSTGALSVFGVVSQLLGITEGPVDFDSGGRLLLVGVVYGTWSTLGVLIGVVTWRFQQATKPTCLACRDA